MKTKTKMKTRPAYGSPEWRKAGREWVEKVIVEALSKEPRRPRKKAVGHRKRK